MVKLIQTKCQIDQGWALLGGWQRTKSHRSQIRTVQYRQLDARTKEKIRLLSTVMLKLAHRDETESLFSKNEN
jgi:hypothetical protein